LATGWGSAVVDREAHAAHQLGDRRRELHHREGQASAVGQALADQARELERQALDEAELAPRAVVARQRGQLGVADRVGELVGPAGRRQVGEAPG
jgi:hypothetical protein